MATSEPALALSQGASARAAVVEIKLSEFRNYRSHTLVSGSQSVVLVGANGAGKTNILEALSYLSPGRGLRRASSEEVATQGGSGRWAVAAEVEGACGLVDIGTGRAVTEAGEGGGRVVKINHVVESQQALSEHIRVVWLTPSMDGLFTGSPSERRRFLDRMVLALDAGHAGRVSSYERAMRSRNKLLEEGCSDRNWLEAVEAEIAELAVAMTAARMETVSRLRPLLAARGSSPFPWSRLELSGTVESLLDQQSAVSAEEAFCQRLRTERGRDARAGRLLEGPHTSELSVFHGPKNQAAEQCSTGEQKALLMGLVLAHARLVQVWSGMTPLVLLDEVAAHLDALRRRGLHEALQALGAQVWMTGTDVAPFAELADDARLFSVEEGKIAPL